VVRTKKSASERVYEIDNDGSRSAWARILARGSACLGASDRLVRAIGRLQGCCGILLGHEDFDFPGSRRLLRDAPFTPDLVHLHNLHGNYFDLRILPWLSHMVPTVVTLHDAWLVSGHCSHGFDCERWRSGCGHCPDLSIYPAIRRDATAYNWRRKQSIYAESNLHVVAPAQWLMTKAMASMLAPAIVSSRVIPHGIDLSVFTAASRSQARLELGLPGDVTILMFSAAGIRDNIWKDYQTMRQAFEILGGRCGSKKLLFIAVGDEGPSEYFGQHELCFVPHSCDRQHLARYYQAADLYVHGAKAEAWGLSITEAMACGLPVVASDVGGIPDQIAESQSGFLVPVGNATLMADRIERLLADDGLRQCMGEWACQRARAEFGLSTMLGHYLEFYQSVLSGNAALSE